MTNQTKLILTPSLIDDFFKDHLPYKITQLTTHHLFKGTIGRSFTNNLIAAKYQICAIEISFVAGRLFLDFLGLSMKQGKLQESPDFRMPHDIKVNDLGGDFVKLSQLTLDEIRILEIFYHRGNKGSAHLTWEDREIDGWQILDEGVEIITRLLKSNLYNVVNREFTAK